MEWLKMKALSSNPSTANKTIKKKTKQKKHQKQKIAVIGEKRPFDIAGRRGKCHSFSWQVWLFLKMLNIELPILE
jgi:hypothetical protein